MDSNTVLSILGAVTGTTSFGALLYTGFSERARLKITDFSKERSYLSAYFKKQILGYQSKYNAYAYIQISNNSKLPICITKARIKYKGKYIYASPKKINQVFSFHNGKTTYTVFNNGQSQLIFPYQLQPFGYIEGYLVFPIFPDLANADVDVTFFIEILTNRKRLLRKKPFGVDVTFLSEKHLLDLSEKHLLETQPKL